MMHFQLYKLKGGHILHHLVNILEGETSDGQYILDDAFLQFIIERHNPIYFPSDDYFWFGVMLHNPRLRPVPFRSMQHVGNQKNDHPQIWENLCADDPLSICIIENASSNISHFRCFTYGRYIWDDDIFNF